MGILSFGVYSFAMTAPGTAQLVNVLAMQVTGETAASGLVGGIVGIITELVVGTLLLVILIKKDVANGLTFAYGPKDVQVADDKELPNWIVSLIPLLSIVVLFNVGHLHRHHDRLADVPRPVAQVSAQTGGKDPA